MITLLGIKAICEKLLISRSSFERLRMGTLLAYINGELSPFPKPTIWMGRRPLWSADSLNQWINP
jgi:hypothetical protein